LENILKKILIITLSSLFISACSSYYSSKGEENYLQAKNGPALVIPPPLTGQNISGFYNLPAQTQNPKVSIEPPTA
jgi:uncharacterized lipoprotein